TLPPKSRVPRRQVNSYLGPLGGLFVLGCGGSGAADPSSNGAGGALSGSGGTSAIGGSPGMGGAGGAGSIDRWATGGTASLTGNYPAPFGNPPSTCALMGSSTEGPCLEDVDLV